MAYLPRHGAVRRIDATIRVVDLPGNPVSSLVCFELFVRPAIARCAGRTLTRERRQPAILACDHVQRDQRPTYFPARLDTNDAAKVPRAEPLAWRGSADLRTLADANSLICFPGGEREFKSGESVDVLPL